MKTESVSREVTYDEYLAVWPNCRTPDCDNKICIGLSETLCYPCATGKARGPDGTVLITATPEEVASWQDATELFWRKHFGDRP